MALSNISLASIWYPITSHKSHELGRMNIMIPRVSTSRNPTVTQDCRAVSVLQSHNPIVTQEPPVDKMDSLDVRRMEKLEEVRRMLHGIHDPLDCLMMVDVLQCLSVDYHFAEEIDEILSRQYKKLGTTDGHHANKSLYGVALNFRLLRQHGYHVSADVFNNFKDGTGQFKLQLREDISGMLGLYEASHHVIEGEDILEEACDFSRKHLDALMTFMEPGLADHVGRSLLHPIHMSLRRFNAKNHLKYQNGANGQKNHCLCDLAKLDFTAVQSLHQKELRVVSKWWRDLGLAEELTFARDQPTKWYMWPLTMLSNPLFSKQRIELMKPISLIYIIDDIFDVHGTLDELACFTKAIDRWEVSDIDKLPRYMQICFMALYNITNEISYLVLKENGWNPINSLRKAWADLCKAFLVEAKWFASGHLPKAEEYLRNGVVSTGLHVVLVHIFYLLGHGITRESVDCVDSIPGLISSSATILRLWDDLGSAVDENQEGKDGSYVECYMKENGITSLATARQHVMNLISMEWKKLNKECLSSNLFSPSFKEASLNAARMVQIMYSYDHNQRLPALEEHINSLLIESIPLQQTHLRTVLTTHH